MFQVLDDIWLLPVMYLYVFLALRLFVQSVLMISRKGRQALMALTS